MNCPKCTYDKRVKSGIIKGKQRYKQGMRMQLYRRVKADRQTEVTEKAGLASTPRRIGGRSIGRFLDVSNVLF
jgi:hypothetical protein